MASCIRTALLAALLALSAAARAAPLGGNCTAVLNRDCTEAACLCFHSAADCEKCANSTKARSKGCTEDEVVEFCKAANPPAKCFNALTRYCVDDQGSKSECEACISKHAKSLAKDNCTAAEEVEFCSGPAVEQ